jgi:hypothetical protein
MILGVTGHQHLSQEAGWIEIRRSVRLIVQAAGTPMVGFTSLAIGADQVFAQEVLRQNGALRVVLPFPRYENRLPRDTRASFRELLAQAEETLVLPRLASDEESYLAAGTRIVDSIDLLVAIWDGRPARGIGGTADIVAYAESRGVPLRRIDASPWV